MDLKTEHNSSQPAHSFRFLGTNSLQNSVAFLTTSYNNMLDVGVTAVANNTLSRKLLGNIFDTILLSIGAEISEGEGSRIRIKLNDVRAVFHRPHPKKETDKGAVASMKRFFENAGIKL